jgi:hypothetical protein
MRRTGIAMSLPIATADRIVLFRTRFREDFAGPLSIECATNGFERVVAELAVRTCHSAQTTTALASPVVFTFAHPDD